MDLMTMHMANLELERQCWNVVSDSNGQADAIIPSEDMDVGVVNEPKPADPVILVIPETTGPAVEEIKLRPKTRRPAWNPLTSRMLPPKQRARLLASRKDRRSVSFAKPDGFVRRSTISKGWRVVPKKKRSQDSRLVFKRNPTSTA